MNDFLNPKSMITPGMAGALVMFLTNAVCFQFPELTPRWMALILSFVLGGIVIAAASLKFLSAFAFWLINSLIIFAVSAGSAGVAAKAAHSATPAAAAIIRALVPAAYAADEPDSTRTTSSAALKAQLDAVTAQRTALAQQLAEAQQEKATAEQQAREAAQARDALAATREQELKQPRQAPADNVNRFFKEWGF